MTYAYACLTCDMCMHTYLPHYRLSLAASAATPTTAPIIACIKAAVASVSLQTAESHDHRDLGSVPALAPACACDCACAPDFNSTSAFGPGTAGIRTRAGPMEGLAGPRAETQSL